MISSAECQERAAECREMAERAPNTTDGSVVIKDREVQTIDEDALRREVTDLMRHFIADYDTVIESCKRALPYMLEAHRRVWQADVGVNRFISRTR